MALKPSISGRYRNGLSQLPALKSENVECNQICLEPACLLLLDSIDSSTGEDTNSLPVCCSNPGIDEYRALDH